MEMSTIKHHFHIQKDSLKFASAHMTVFPDGQKEALHGHNYTTRVSLELSSIALKDTIAFSVVKKMMREICQQWDEKVLLPALCPFFRILKRDQQEVEFILCQKRYVLPADETVFLDLDNITSESLAGEFSRRLILGLNGLPEFSVVESVSVVIEESPGQGGTCVWRRH